MKRGPVLLIGYGYIGREVGAALLHRGLHVTAWSKSGDFGNGPELANPHLSTHSGDIADPISWWGLPSNFATVIHVASSNRGGADAYRAVFVEGVRQIAGRLPHARLCLVSSTSVYAQSGGEVVTEESPAQPTTETGLLLRAAEDEALARFGEKALVFRSAGIYGPGRGVLFRRFLDGEAVIEGDGLRWMNQIHRDDLVNALLHGLDTSLHGLFNAADDQPATHLDFYRWLAERTGKPLPPFGPVNVERKRGLTDKRVSNARLRATGWTPAYRSFREGLDAELKTL
ncbi:NAD-dependent epimerase/dehydratase family protein [Verrucomicrobium sp. GAS474]|uniref:NAD-dependent epimerase/dehydratase family protein n=1 Tax=Verrucomicrobium sp. GAS474 TaxID=1882831 RepID=UPI0012FFA083|nr:NAD-dependent epimerase/dehydratase family protein [Verrucomicrobium sp. GAS474]